MNKEFTNREGSNLNRRKITVLNTYMDENNREVYEVNIERCDNATTEGTRLEATSLKEIIEGMIEEKLEEERNKNEGAGPPEYEIDKELVEVRGINEEAEYTITTKENISVVLDGNNDSSVISCTISETVAGRVTIKARYNREQTTTNSQEFYIIISNGERSVTQKLTIRYIYTESETPEVATTYTVSSNSQTFIKGEEPAIYQVVMTSNNSGKIYLKALIIPVNDYIKLTITTPGTKSILQFEEETDALELIPEGGIDTTLEYVIGVYSDEGYNNQIGEEIIEIRYINNGTSTPTEPVNPVPPEVLYEIDRVVGVVTSRYETVSYVITSNREVTVTVEDVPTCLNVIVSETPNTSITVLASYNTVQSATTSEGFNIVISDGDNTKTQRVSIKYIYYVPQSYTINRTYKNLTTGQTYDFVLTSEDNIAVTVTNKNAMLTTVTSNNNSQLVVVNVGVKDNTTMAQALEMTIKVDDAYGQNIGYEYITIYYTPSSTTPLD